MKAWPGLVALALVGCATGTTTVEPDRQTLLEEMQRRILALQRQAVVSELEIERLRRQVADLEGGLERMEQPRSPVGSVSDHRVREDSPLVAPVVRYEEPVEESDLDADEVAPTTSIGSVVAQSPTSPEATETPAGPSVTTSSAPPAPVSSEAQDVYDRGYTLYHQGRYADAERQFQQFLAEYPPSELSDNAQYWIGECRFARGEFRQALDAFQSVIDRYTESNKLPDALLKSGDALQRLGDPSGARQRYEELQRRFPGTAAAAAAEERSGTP